MKRQTRKRTPKESRSRREQGSETRNPELAQGRAIAANKGEQSVEDNIPEPTATKIKNKLPQERGSKGHREERRREEARLVTRGIDKLQGKGKRHKKTGQQPEKKRRGSRQSERPRTTRKRKP